MLLADVILPLPVKSNYTYKVPEDMADFAEPGMRVLVHFGKSKMYTGVIKALREVSEEDTPLKLKRIQEFPDQFPVLRPQQLAMFEWMSGYYFCTEGEVLKASLPAGLKLESEMVAEWIERDENVGQGLSEADENFLRILRNRMVMSLEEVGKVLELQNPLSRLRSMEVRGLLRVNLRLREGYKVKTVKFVELTEAYRAEEALNSVFNGLRNAPKQEEVLMLVVEQHLKGKAIRRKELKERIDGPESAIKALAEKGVLQQFEVPVDRLAALHYRENRKEITFTGEQIQGLEQIRTSFANHPGKPVLLHGVTGSGKTHLYIELIREALERGEEVLYLLPEIALTQQIIDKVKTEFGVVVGVYHSRFNDQERVEIWQKLLLGEYKVVIGVRSAVFMPFKNLGLIIVDEEHDQSFKQSEPSPRYNSRDVAVVLAKTLPCQVVLGSATPSFESYQNARDGRYTLVELLDRATASVLPEIEIVDMREQRKKKLVQGAFSQPLIAQMKTVLERREQAILFQNRRGFVPWITCRTCGHVPRCINCDISLTFHKGKNHLRCHYCGYTDHVVDKCAHCGSYEIGMIGVGTERIEEELQVLFPEARIARMDLDTTQTRLGFLKLIRSFEAHEIDVLVGTQMVSKGLDFGNVTLVGVIDADLQLNFADFRAYEHAYQLLTQVSGRAGRNEKPGRVVIQTSQPDNFVLKHLQKPFGPFFDFETTSRRELNYPPFTRLIRIELKHKNQLYLESQADAFRKLLLPTFGSALLGPEYPYVTRLRNEYRQQALLKIGRNMNVAKLRGVLKELIDTYYRNAPQKTLRVIVDVDPV